MAKLLQKTLAYKSNREAVYQPLYRQLIYSVSIIALQL